MTDTTMAVTTPQTIADRVALHGYRIEHLAELVRLCNEDIHRELAAIGRRHPDALVQHSQDVTDQVDTLADLLCETAEKIRAEADALEDVARRQKGAANDAP